jgi:hypothetical protein
MYWHQSDDHDSFRLPNFGVILQYRKSGHSYLFGEDGVNGARRYNASDRSEQRVESIVPKWTSKHKYYYVNIPAHAHVIYTLKSTKIPIKNMPLHVSVHL